MNGETAGYDIIRGIMLIDEKGNETEYGLVDKFAYGGSVYYVLLPADEIGADTEYVILREAGASDDGESILEGLEDAELLDEVFNLFKQRQACDAPAD